MKRLLLFLVGIAILIGTMGNVSAIWVSDTDIVSGLVDVGHQSTPDVFYKDSTWYLITGDSAGTFNGFNWTGSAWQSDSDIVSGLGDVGQRSAPEIFYKDSTWYLISGKLAGTFNGFNWTGSAWQSDSDIISGLPDVPYVDFDLRPEVFYNDSTWYMITGEGDGTFNGFNWTGSTWQSDSDITGGLVDVGNISMLSVFNDSGTWKLIAGNETGEFNGFNWTGSAWQSDSDIISGLGDIGARSTPAVFNDSGTWKLIAGNETGEFTGYEWEPAIPASTYIPPDPTTLANTVNETTYSVNWTWGAGSGNVTNSYNVSYNGTWTNGSANTYYNHVLGSAGTSTIIVWAYNNSDTGTLSAASVSDSQVVEALYDPPTPVNLTNTEGVHWMNWTWDAGTGNVTDTYNVSVNGSWTNDSANTYYNHTTLGAHGTSTIIVHAWNSSSTGTVSTANVTDSQVLANNLPVISANVIVGGGTSGDQISVSSASATDVDSDAMVDTYVWYVNSVEVSALENETVVPTSYFTDDDTVQMLFNCSDGYGYTTLLSNTITIGTPEPAGGTSPPANGDDAGTDTEIIYDSEDYTPGGFVMAPSQITKSVLYTALGKEQIVTYEIASSAFLESCSTDIEGATCSIVDDYSILVNIPINEGDEKIDGYVYGYTGDARSQYARFNVPIFDVGGGIEMMDVPVGDNIAKLLNLFFMTADGMLTGIRNYTSIFLILGFLHFSKKKK